MSFWETLILGVIAALVGSLLQYRSWRHQHLTTLRNNERKGALDVVECISDDIDQRLLGQLKFLAICEQRHPSSDELGEYRQVVNQWMSKLSANKAKISFYFDRETAREFENNIHSSLRLSSDFMLLRARYGLEHLSKDDLKRFRSSRTRVNIARRECYKFLQELNDRIESGLIGTTQRINNLEIADLDYISSSYLIKRLLGIRA